ncbi:MAG TPA: M13 family metallopeptidase [Pirellulales bacterium]|nr:M13 family metallopeptidase [Pirellulales bacterium]
MRIRQIVVLCIGLSCSLPLAMRAIGGDAPLKSGIDRANFDTSVKPGDDFFQYVNGDWNKRNPIPAEYSRWGSFSQLHDDNLVALREIVEGLAKQPGPLEGNKQKIRDFFATAMDEAKLEKQGAAPLKDERDRIAKIASRDDLIAEIGHLEATGVRSLFSASVGQDEKQSTRYAVYLHQGGLGLPERDYYLGTSDYFKLIRRQYREHATKMFSLLGDSSAAAAVAADTVLAIETKLAEASRTPVQLRDREANYNKYTLADLAKQTPNLNWELYWKAAEIGKLSDVIVGQPEFFTRVNELLASVPAEQWQAYLRWRLIRATASYLSDPFERESFRFYDETLRGVKQMQPRWKRAIGAIDSRIGEALGQLYVEKYFPPEAKRRMDDLVKNIMAAYRERIEMLDWMGPETKKQALAKLSTVMPKIGYPDKWRDYSTLQIGTDSYAANVLRAEAFDWQYRVAKLGKPVDRLEWGMTPPTVNAYYNASLNEIVFPAGILQPPFFDPTADDAVNFGAIGAVIGHEITHGFDDQGSRSDAEGNLRNWWTADDRARFTAKTDKLVEQYEACKLLGDLHVNGRLTLGENLADLGGVTIAYAAYQRSLGGKEAPVIDGFTGPQRFFIGFAQVWRGATRDAQQRVMLRTDPHSPVQFRALVPLSNVQAFYDAFAIKPGDAMYRPPEKRVQVW